MQKKNARFPVSISKTRFNQEPTEEQLAETKYELDYLNLHELFELLNYGYTYCHYYKDTEGEPFGSEIISSKTFQEAHFVCLELFTSDYISFSELLQFMEDKPSLAFPKLKEDNGLNRYCFIYLFNKPIRSGAFYKQLADAIAETLKSSCNYLIKVDTINIDEPIWGNCVPKIEKERTTHVFEFSDFIEQPCGAANPVPFVELPSQNIPLTDFTDLEFKTDFYNIRDVFSYQTFEAKYAEKYKFFDRTELPQVSANEMYIELPKNYIEIKRQHGRVKDQYGKLTRLSLLKTNALLRRKIKPDISFEYLLYCLVIERQYHFDNSDGMLKNNLLVDICREAMDCKTINIKVKNTNKKCIVNPSFCEEYGVNKRAIAGYRRTYEIDKYLDANYNPCLTPKENIELFENNGFKVCKTKIYNYCKVNGISTKPRNVIS